MEATIKAVRARILARLALQQQLTSLGRLGYHKKLPQSCAVVHNCLHDCLLGNFSKAEGDTGDIVDQKMNYCESRDALKSCRPCLQTGRIILALGIH